jgi:hypothetical protein
MINDVPLIGAATQAEIERAAKTAVLREVIDRVPVSRQDRRRSNHDYEA